MKKVIEGWVCEKDHELFGSRTRSMPDAQSAVMFLSDKAYALEDIHVRLTLEIIEGEE